MSGDLQHVIRDLATIRRVVVDHIFTGLNHPDPVAVRQARALATEMDAAGLNVDREVDALSAEATA
jgi:hypothetical protein